MRWFSRNTKSPSGIRQDLVNKLRKVSDSEIIRWVDNTHTNMGISIQELRKNQGTHETALIHASDLTEQAQAVIAAMYVIKERRDSSTVAFERQPGRSST